MKRLWRPTFVDIWDAAWFQSLTPTGRLLYFYATTGPHTNRCGLFRFSLAEAVDRLAIDPHEAHQQFEAICRAQAWEYDSACRVLWVPTWWLDNPAFCANESALRGAVKDLIRLPRTALLQRFFENGVPTNGVDEARWYDIVSETLGDLGFGAPNDPALDGARDLGPYRVEHLGADRLGEQSTVQHQQEQQERRQDLIAPSQAQPDDGRLARLRNAVGGTGARRSPAVQVAGRLR